MKFISPESTVYTTTYNGVVLQIMCALLSGDPHIYKGDLISRANELAKYYFEEQDIMKQS